LTEIKENSIKKISVILAHPEKNSFNHAIAEVAVRTLRELGHQVSYHDLCHENFDPLLPSEEFPKEVDLPPEIEIHCNEISQADGIIIVHPNWWGQPPAILKGWIDRVIRPGVAYEFLEGDTGEGIPIGLLKAKWAIVFNTSNTEADREVRVFGDPLETIWKNCIFELCGIKNFYRKTFNIIVTSSEEQRTEWLKEVRNTVVEYFG
jgi:putative NADPH-quinone reductase